MVTESISGSNELSEFAFCRVVGAKDVSNLRKYIAHDNIGTEPLISSSGWVGTQENVYTSWWRAKWLKKWH